MGLEGEDGGVGEGYGDGGDEGEEGEVEGGCVGC